MCHMHIYPTAYADDFRTAAEYEFAIFYAAEVKKELLLKSRSNSFFIQNL